MHNDFLLNSYGTGKPLILASSLSNGMCVLTVSIGLCLAISTAERFLRAVGFAFSVIGVFLIVCAIEATRRSARDYDRMLQTQRMLKSDNGAPKDM